METWKPPKKWINMMKNGVTVLRKLFLFSLERSSLKNLGKYSTNWFVSTDTRDRAPWFRVFMLSTTCYILGPENNPVVEIGEKPGA